MGIQRGRQRNWRFSGLAFRISLMVFVATFFASLVITWISVHSIATALRGELERRFPALLERASAALDLWYQERERDVAAFASSPFLLDALASRGGATREKASSYLSSLLERSPHYSALLVLDREGNEMLGARGKPELRGSLPASLDGAERTGVSRIFYLEGRRTQLVSAPLEDARGNRVATLHAVLRLETLKPLLTQSEITASTILQLVDGNGRALGGGAQLFPQGALGEIAEEGQEAEVTIAEYPSGERIVASAVRLPRSGWTLVAAEPYDVAFAPVQASIRRTLGINLSTVLLAGVAAFAFATWRVRPILALAEGARRLSEGEAAVEVVDSGSGDEIQVLARTFNQMSARLQQSRLDLESRNQELRQANEALEQLSITDSLTRLHNHRFFQDQFAREAKRVERTGSPLCLVLIDLDDFKSLNDRLGHAAGDAVLARAARAMNAVLRETDVLCRYGGEEFALLSPQTDLSGAISLAEKIRGAVARTDYAVVGPDGPIRITVSIGVAEFSKSTGETFNAADRALYEAKAAGKDCVVAAPLGG